MIRTRSSLLALSVPIALAACGGGGGGGGSGAPASSDVALRFSDAPVEALERVVITVDAVTFRPEEGEPVTVERFTSAELGLEEAETFTIDLLEVQGAENRLVLDSVVLPVGRYSDLRLDIVDEDINFSFVEESAGSALKTLKVPSGELKLGAFEVSPLSTQTFVIEFGLRQSMTYNPGPDRYILKPRGVRIVALEEAAAIEGEIDLDALYAEASCAAEPDPAAGTVAYLYGGHSLDAAALADDFDPAVAGAEADGRIAPIASVSPDADGRFVLAYLEPGDYTLALSCAAAGDDADALDGGIVVPQPAGQLVETSLVRGESRLCSFGSGTPTCAPQGEDGAADTE